MKLLIAIPSNDTMPFQFVESLLKLTRRLSEDGVDYEVAIQGGTLVHVGRDKLALKAIGGDYTHVLWLDSDMVFTEDLFDDLMDSGKDFVTGIAHARREPYPSCCRIIYEDDNFFGGYDKVIVSIDKDFYSVPCTFYRDLPTNTEGAVVVSKEEADYNLMKQIIMGDTADNYKGITGYGEKKTETFLSEGKKTLADVCELFRKEGLTGSEYVKNKVCATIVGIKQYNFTTGEVKLTEV